MFKIALMAFCLFLESVVVFVTDFDNNDKKNYFVIASSIRPKLGTVNLVFDKTVSKITKILHGNDSI